MKRTRANGGNAMHHGVHLSGCVRLLICPASTTPLFETQKEYENHLQNRK